MRAALPVALALVALLQPRTCAHPSPEPTRAPLTPLMSPRLQYTPEGTYRPDTCWRVAGPRPVPCWTFPLDSASAARHLPPRLFTERTA